MLPEDRSDNRNKNDTSPMQCNFNDCEEVDEDLVEIYRSYNKRKEEDEVLEVGVLVINPGNNQRLLTCGVPLHCDERDILAEPPCSDGDNLDVEVIEVPRVETSRVSENDEIEEIRTDDDVFIEKIIMNHNLSDHPMDEAAEPANAKRYSWEAMELDERQNEVGQLGIDKNVIPIARSATPVDEDAEIEELPAPVERVAIDNEDRKAESPIEEFSPKIQSVTSIDDFFGDIHECVEEIVDILDESQVEAVDKDAIEEREVDLEIKNMESENKMEKGRWLSFESLAASENEPEEAKAVSNEEKESASEKEMDEGEVPADEHVETVCIVDDTLDDDDNENSSQTPTNKTILFIYPMSRGGITVTRDDYECLSEYQYLNDIIIDFYLNYLIQEVLSQEDRERTHLFSSHFYTRLTKHTADEDSDSLSLDERRYAGVQRWTKDVNIFEKDFIIVPINEHSHWFLAIICFPKLVDFVGYRDCDCEHAGIELQKPCILIFDSLGGTKKTRVAVTLRGYLRHEYMSKMNEEKQFNSLNLKMVTPKAPCQQNATDCGLYVLQYVEHFFKDPILDFTLPLKNLSDWFPTVVIDRKRERIAKLIAKLAVKHNNNKIVKLPLLTFPKPKPVTPTQATSSSSVKTKKIEFKAKVQPKKKVQTKRMNTNKRLKKLCDSDSDSDAASRTASTKVRSKLQMSAHNPQPLRRSACVPRSEVLSYFSSGESDVSVPSAAKSTPAVPSSFLKKDINSNSAFNRTDPQAKKGPRKIWPNFSELTGSKSGKEKLAVSNSRSHVTDLTEAKQKDKQDSSSSHEILKSAGISTDRFYNLSLDALFKTEGLPPDMGFTKFKIRKKNLNSET